MVELVIPYRKPEEALEVAQLVPEGPSTSFAEARTHVSIMKVTTHEMVPGGWYMF
jgi:hypothetical protein